MAKQTFTTGQVLTAAQMTSLQQTAMGGGSTTAKTVSYTLVAADAGTVIQMNSASATTITVNTGLFAAGDTVQIQNIGAGICTVTAGTATVNTAGSLALSQYENGTLYFTATGASLFFDTFQSSGSASGFNFITSQTFSAAASQSVNSCFTSTYTNYRMFITLSGVSADANVALFMRAAGTDNSSANNGSSWWGTNALGAALAANSNGATAWGLFDVDSGSNAARYSCVIDIANPQVTSDTTATWQSQYIVAASSAIAWNAGGGLNYTGASYDGFTLKMTTGNMTGKVWVYGYSNS